MPEPKEQEREASPKQTERSFEVGMDEVFKTVATMTAANVKRTYDEFQQESLESIRRNRTYVDEVLHDSRNHSKRTLISRPRMSWILRISLTNRQQLTGILRLTVSGTSMK
jgi:hypothetical protein